MDWLSYFTFFLVFNLITMSSSFGLEKIRNMDVENNLIVEMDDSEWVKKGVLYNTWLKDYAVSCTVTYIDENFGQYPLTGNVDNISYMIKEELSEYEIQSFIRDQLPKLLVYFMNGGLIVDDMYFRFYGTEDTMVGEWKCWFEIEKTQSDEFLGVLRTNAIPIAVELVENDFVISFNVLTHDAYLENWKFLGTVKPFNIDSLKKDKLFESQIPPPILDGPLMYNSMKWLGVEGYNKTIQRFKKKNGIPVR